MKKHSDFQKATKEQNTGEFDGSGALLHSLQDGDLLHCDGPLVFGVHVGPDPETQRLKSVCDVS